MSADQASDALYLGPTILYRVIDVGLKTATDDEALIFVRASAHEPAGWDETWDPAGNGPFKVLDRWSDQPGGPLP